MNAINVLRIVLLVTILMQMGTFERTGVLIRMDLMILRRLVCDVRFARSK